MQGGKKGVEEGVYLAQGESSALAEEVDILGRSLVDLSCVHYVKV